MRGEVDEGGARGEEQMDLFKFSVLIRILLVRREREERRRGKCKRKGTIKFKFICPDDARTRRQDAANVRGTNGGSWGTCIRGSLREGQVHVR
jgi:hypothetical protein